jgi:TRAP-type C4-dicarboxylate transport system permease small subunit
MSGPFFMRDRYRQAMQALYLACIVLSGAALVVITLIIPLGVFMRYVMNAALSWPEPASVIMMVMFSFLGGAAVYRAKVHVAVEALLNAVSENKRKVMLWAVDACMIATALFMLVYGVQLCITTWYQSISDFPGLSVGLTYMPIPLAGVLTLLFIVERIWLGDPPKSDVMYSDQAVDLE